MDHEQEFEGSGDDSDATTWSSSDSEKEEVITADFDELDRWICTSSIIAKSFLQRIENNECSLDNTCISCWISDGAKFSHPFFEGGVCGLCRQRLLCTMFAVSSKGTHLYCAICGSRSEQCAVCSEFSCQRTYCLNCLTIWLSEWEELIGNSSWLCFLCNGKDITNQNNTIPMLKTHSDWMNRILSFHEPCSIIAQRALSWKKERLRVVSLFDGIGTGLFVLRHLGIDVETYYASEIFTAATTVSRTRLGAPIRHVGSVGEVTLKRLEAMRPIHLLVGGSPCNDFSAINRFPKDFYDPKGSARYFYDFFRVLRVLQRINGDQHLLWLYENVASMPRSYRERITKHLQCEPAIIDAKDFSPQLRKRLFWGNIPGLYTVPNNNQIEGEMTLNMALIPNSGRQAALNKVRTLTTNTNSLLQGRTENCNSRKDIMSLFPVHWDSKLQSEFRERDEGTSSTSRKNKRKKKAHHSPEKSDHSSEEQDDQVDVLWLPEIEEVFGYPRHYTDVGNLSRSDRQKLLGHTWSVPIIAFIMSQLKNYTLQAAPSDSINFE